LVFGHIRSEVIAINEEHLWLHGSSGEGVRLNEVPNLGESLAEARRELLAGRYEEAQNLLSSLQVPYAIDPFQPGPDIRLSSAGGVCSDYRRRLDFQTGEAIVEWREAGSSHERRVLASRADQAVVIKWTAEGGILPDVTIWLSARDSEPRVSLGSGQDAAPAQPPFEWEKNVIGNELVYRAVYPDGHAHVAVARLESDGECLFNVNGITLSGASKLLLAVKLEAGTESELNSICERLSDELKRMRLEQGYESLLERHLGEHAVMFNRVMLNIGDTKDKDVNQDKHIENEALLAQAYAGHVSGSLVERMYYYGRYLLLSSSRSGGLPAHLQGLWNGDYWPAWSCDYHNDENIQMNYWQALAGSLAEVTDPYVDYYLSMMSDYRENARTLYGCRGILAPIAQSTHGRMQGGGWMAWTAAAGWLAQLLYDRWLHTGDRTFLLNKALPFLAETALFYEDFVESDESGLLRFAPSLSPENYPSSRPHCYVTVNAAMDIAVAREVWLHAATACHELKVREGDAARWRALADRLPPYGVNADGAFREWLQDELEDHYPHRHLSHLYPVFPGWELMEETTPELFRAAERALELRLELGLNEQTGWSLVHMALLYARFGRGDKSLECLELLCRSCVGPNLFTYHNDWRAQGITMFWGHGALPPFQIDANMGFAAAVQEMLLFSAPGWIKLLPALPERWAHGRITGLSTRCGVTVSLDWDKDGLQAVLTASRDADFTLRLPYAASEISMLSARGLDTGRLLPSSYGLCYRELSLGSGESITLQARRAAESDTPQIWKEELA
jgi:alpha-L-fucosidase 2